MTTLADGLAGDAPQPELVAPSLDRVPGADPQGITGQGSELRVDALARLLDHPQGWASGSAHDPRSAADGGLSRSAGLADAARPSPSRAGMSE